MPGIFLTTNIFAHVGGFFYPDFRGESGGDGDDLSDTIVKGSSGDGTINLTVGFALPDGRICAFGVIRLAFACK